jgi:hypothetical protein
VTQFVINTVQKPSFISVPTGILQRKCACGQHTTDQHGECTECRKNRVGLQRRAASVGRPETVPPIVHEVLHSPGRPLDPATRAFMEPRFGHDFSQVRIHTNSSAAESARTVNAFAYTVGQDIVFNTGNYAPHTLSGLSLLTHELVHTVQQKNIPGFARSDLQVAPNNDVHEREAQQKSALISHGKSSHILLLQALLSNVPVDRQQLVVSVVVLELAVKIYSILV